MVSCPVCKREYETWETHEIKCLIEFGKCSRHFDDCPICVIERESKKKKED